MEPLSKLGNDENLTQSASYRRRAERNWSFFFPLFFYALRDLCGKKFSCYQGLNQAKVKYYFSPRLCVHPSFEGNPAHKDWVFSNQMLGRVRSSAPTCNPRP